MIGNFLILVIIGAAVGYAMLHYGSTWLRRQFATTSGEITYGLVGIAGSFMGYDIGVILGLARADPALHPGDHRRRPHHLPVARSLGALSALRLTAERPPRPALGCGGFGFRASPSCRRRPAPSGSASAPRCPRAGRSRCRGAPSRSSRQRSAPSRPSRTGRGCGSAAPSRRRRPLRLFLSLLRCASSHSLRISVRSV